MAINNERKKKENIIPELSINPKGAWWDITPMSWENIKPKNNFADSLKRSPLGSLGKNQVTETSLKDINAFSEKPKEEKITPLTEWIKPQQKGQTKEDIAIAPTTTPLVSTPTTVTDLEKQASSGKWLYQSLLEQTSKKTSEKEMALNKTKADIESQLSQKTWSWLAPELEEKISWPYTQLLETIKQEKELAESDLEIDVKATKDLYDSAITRQAQTNQINKTNMEKLAAVTGFSFSTTGQDALATSLQNGTDAINNLSKARVWMLQKYSNQDRKLDIDYMKDIMSLQADLDKRLSNKYSEMTAKIQSIDADIGKNSNEWLTAIKDIVKDYMQFNDTQTDNALNKSKFAFDQMKFQKEENRRNDENVKKKQNEQLSRLFSSWDIMNMNMDHLMTITQNLDLTPTELILLQGKQLNGSVKALNDYGDKMKIWAIWTENIDDIQKRLTAWESPVDIIKWITGGITPEEIEKRQLEIGTRKVEKPEEWPKWVTRWVAPVWAIKEWDSTVIDRGQDNPYLGKVGWSLTFRTNNPWALTATSKKHADRLAQKYGAIPGLYSLDANNDYVLNFESKEAWSRAMAQNLKNNYGNLTLREVAPKWAFWQWEAHLSKMQKAGLDINKKVNDLTPEEFTKLTDSISQAEVFDEGQTTTPTQTLGEDTTKATPSAEKYDNYEIKVLNEGKNKNITPEESRDFYNTKAEIFENPYSDILDVIRYSRGQSGSGQSKLSDTFINQLNKTWIVSWQLEQLSSSITKGNGWKTQPVYDEEWTLVQKSEDIDLWPITWWFEEKNPWDKDAQSVRAILNQTIPNIARWIYGEVGVLSDQDIKFYTKTLPNLQQTEDVKKLVLAATLRVVRSWVDNQMRNLAWAWRDVSNLGASYKKIDSQLKKLEWELWINRNETNEWQVQDTTEPEVKSEAPAESSPFDINSYRIDEGSKEIPTSENIINSSPINYSVPTQAVPEPTQKWGINFAEPWQKLGKFLGGEKTAETVWKIGLGAVDPTWIGRESVREIWERAWADLSWIPKSPLTEYWERTYGEPVRKAWTWLARIWEKILSLSSDDPKDFSTNIYEDILDVWEGSLQAWLGVVFPTTTVGMDIASWTEGWKKTLEAIGKVVQTGWRVINSIPWLSDYKKNLPPERRADFDWFIWSIGAFKLGKQVSKKTVDDAITKYEAQATRWTQMIARPTPTQVKFGIAEGGKRWINDVLANLKIKDPTYGNLLSETKKLKNRAYKPLKDGLNAIKWVYKSKSVSWALDSLKDAYEGVKSEASKKIANEIDDLAVLNKTTWLTLSQINRVKTLHTQANKLFEAWKEKGKTFNADDMRSLRTEIKNFVETEAAKKWFKDVKEINKRYWDLADAEILLKDKVTAKEVAESKVPIPTKIENISALIEKVPFASSTVDWIRQILGTKRGGQSLSILEIEAKLPEIIKHIQKNENPTMLQQFMLNLRKAWVNIPKVIGVKWVEEIEE